MRDLSWTQLCQNPILTDCIQQSSFFDWLMINWLLNRVILFPGFQIWLWTLDLNDLGLPELGLIGLTGIGLGLWQSSYLHSRLRILRRTFLCSLLRWLCTLTPCSKFQWIRQQQCRHHCWTSQFETHWTLKQNKLMKNVVKSESINSHFPSLSPSCNSEASGAAAAADTRRGRTSHCI